MQTEKEVFVIFKQNHDVLSSINFVCRLLASQRATAFCTGARNQKELCNTISMNNDIVMILRTQRLITVSCGPDEYYNSIGAYLPRWPTVVAPHAPQVELLIENNALPRDPGLTKIIGKKIIPSLTHSIRQSYQFFNFHIAAGWVANLIFLSK